MYGLARSGAQQENAAKGGIADDFLITDVFEKAGVNFSAVHGEAPDSMQAAAQRLVDVVAASRVVARDREGVASVRGRRQF